jgi:hypothetical protein
LFLKLDSDNVANIINANAPKNVTSNLEASPHFDISNDKLKNEPNKYINTKPMHPIKILFTNSFISYLFLNPSVKYCCIIYAYIVLCVTISCGDQPFSKNEKSIVEIKKAT